MENKNSASGTQSGMENKMAIIYPPRFGGFLVVLVSARMLRI